MNQREELICVKLKWRPWRCDWKKRCNLSYTFVCIEEENEAAIPTCPAIILSTPYLDPLSSTLAAWVQDTVRCLGCPSLSVCVCVPPYLALPASHLITPGIQALTIPSSDQPLHPQSSPSPSQTQALYISSPDCPSPHWEPLVGTTV